MTHNELIAKWGNSYRIPVLIGNNLNLVQVRSFAPLDFLADISGADVFDQVTNPEGTQRELKKPHAKEAYEYAMGAATVDPVDDARAFSEVILNVRDQSLLKLIVDGKPVSFDELELSDGEPVQAELLIELSALTYPQSDIEPEISRVDGNHRLSSVEAISKRDSNLDFPVITFAMFVGLTKEQELKIFADINGKQQKMDTSHLNQILANQKGEKALLSHKTRSRWFAKQLSSSGMPFFGMVFMGGSRKGLKKRDGVTPPVSFTGLTTMIGHTLKGMEELVAKELSTEDCIAAAGGDKAKLEQILRKSAALEKLIAAYWVAVSEVFPEAWNDKKKSEYLLFDATGSVAMSMLGGSIITQAVSDKKVQVTDFKNTLSAIREEGVTLRKTSYPSGLAGLAGTKVVYESLVKAKQSGESGLAGVIGDLVPEAKSKLDE